MGRLEGKVAVVTGGVRGIGRGIVEAFAAEGADVAVADVLQEGDAAPVLARVERLGQRGLYVRTDVSREGEVRGMVGEVIEAFGRIDVLVNNAGVLSRSPLEQMPVEEWDRVLGINLRGTFLCCRFALPHMLRRGEGKIVNVASQLGQVGAPELAHYSASKGGVIAFTKALAREVAARVSWSTPWRPGRSRPVSCRPRARSRRKPSRPRSRFGASARLRRSGRRWSFSPRTRPRTTWARPSAPTAGM
jgi:3-oxoacyl-[acyl-carrier protein] reductase